MAAVLFHQKAGDFNDPACLCFIESRALYEFLHGSYRSSSEAPAVRIDPEELARHNFSRLIPAPGAQDRGDQCLPWVILPKMAQHRRAMICFQSL